MIAGAPYEIDVDLPDPGRIFDEITARIDAGDGEAGSPAAQAGAGPVVPIGRARRLSDSDYGEIARWVFEGEAAEAHSGLAEARDRAGSIGRTDAPNEREASADAARESQSGNVIVGPWRLPSAWAAAAAVALFVLGGLGGSYLSASAERSDAAVYRTATSGTAESQPVRAGDPMIDVVFAESAELGEVSRTLRRLGLEIVAGPSSMGVYRLRVKSLGTSAGSAAAEGSTAAGASGTGSRDADSVAGQLREAEGEAEAAIAIFAESVP